MSSFNQVILMGNLTRDPEMRFIPSGAAVCEFSIAVNRTWNDKGGEKKEEVGFFDCVAWARTAEVIAEYMKKGRPIMVVGRLTQDRWQDKASGQNRSKVRITVERFQFVGGRDDGSAAPVEAESAGAAEAPPEGELPF